MLWQKQKAMLLSHTPELRMNPKGRLSPCKRRPFASQKAVFYNAPDYQQVTRVAGNTAETDADRPTGINQTAAKSLRRKLGTRQNSGVERRAICARKQQN